MKYWLTSSLTVVLALVLATGCNVYEGFYEEGASDDPEVLLEDARIAMQRNEPDKAVDHLRKALSKADKGSTVEKRVQIKLASAILQTQEINALTLSRMARTFSSEANKAGAGKTAGEVCNFPAEHSRESFDPHAGIDFGRLGSEESVAARSEASALIADVFNQTTTSSSPTFPCDDAGMDQAIADLQAQGMTDAEIAEALVDYAVVLSTTAYVDVVNVGGDLAEFFYATPPAGADYIGICFPDVATCEASVAATTDNLPSFDCATRLLQKRAALLGSTTATELADLARDGYVTMESAVQNAQCVAN